MSSRLVTDPEQVGVRYHHAIVTRFNVSHDELGTSGGLGLEPEWLRHRIRLFERYCAPSVASQTSRDFRWLVFLHTATPPGFVGQIAELVDAAGGELVRADRGMPQEVLAALGRMPPGDVLLTTRLDNDDALARSFVGRVRAQSGAELPYVVNLRRGCQVNDNGHVRLVRHDSSPFITYAERLFDGLEPLTVWGFPHRHPPSYARFIQVGGDLGWMVSVHDRNIANPRREGIQLTRAAVLKRFDVAADAIAETSLSGIASALARDIAAMGRRRMSRLRSHSRPREASRAQLRK